METLSVQRVQAQNKMDMLDFRVLEILNSGFLLFLNLFLYFYFHLGLLSVVIECK